MTRQTGAGEPLGTRLFWGTIVFGLLVPVFLVEVSSAVVVGGRSIGRALADLPRLLFAPGYNLWLIIVWTAVPFVLVAVWVREAAQRWHSEESSARIRTVAGIIVGAVAAIGFILWAQCDIWTRTHGGAKGTSTAGVGLLFIPIYALGLLLVGRMVGEQVGRVIRKSAER